MAFRPIPDDDSTTASQAPTPIEAIPIEDKVGAVLPVVAKVLDGLATPMERAQMAEPAAALRRGAGHARAIAEGVQSTVTAGRSLLSALGALLPAPGVRPRRRPSSSARGGR